MIPYSRPKLSDLYTLSQSKQLENHTLHSGTGPLWQFHGGGFATVFPRVYCFQSLEIEILHVIVTFNCTSESL